MSWHRRVRSRKREILDFYLKQVADLKKQNDNYFAKSLEEINKTAVERFNNTFSQIRDQFHKTAIQNPL